MEKNAHIKIKVRSGDGGTFQSSGPCSERLAFTVWLLVSGGDEIGTAATPESAEFHRLAAALLEAGERYHAALVKRRENG